ncbi:S49 family peptidase [Hydrogenophaga pseudoflava]|uniref:S49 family peptidase n=1 Tax=Hydrogenophaga pseudoflava TaxID=47421 RepID=UPI000A061269|nr:S49 family peptidase [Hydrogenophaga pseudoflava]
MNTPHTHSAEHGHAAALQTLFPGRLAAMDVAGVRATIDEFLARRETYTGPLEAPTARAGLMPGQGANGVSYQVLAGGVARIEWDGPMGQRPHFLARLFLGYVDTSEITAAVQAAASDPAVRSILMVVSSPGGAVPGVAELAEVVAEASRSKPVVAVTDGLLASAAYWAVSGASSVYGSGPTVQVGSVGVVSVHVYSPRTDGSVVTEITAGKFKRMASAAQPLSGDGKAYLQEMVDHLASVFINGVAKGRNLAPSAVAAQEARVYIGQQAVDAGLLDGFATASSLEKQLAADPSRFMRRKAGGGASGTPARASASTTWPPKLQPVVSAPVTPAALLEQTGQAEEDMRADAAEIVRLHRLRTGRMPIVMNSWKAWEQAGAARARQDGCTLLEGIKREGYLHPYVSTPDSPKRGAAGVKPTLQLSKQQIAERAAAWAQFKGIGVVEACKWLGVRF